ncbi:hypothetical protein CDAR_371451 [Caerostris darwini]|uniref:Uncharacterized protein n=1 Tax=Caerostris darwini TaxID=1538125 RepID=A0AAV4XBX0_9ARAC|nr:hypothetical protein CDAR_371451 [Caerostris darwini]
MKGRASSSPLTIPLLPSLLFPIAYSSGLHEDANEVDFQEKSLLPTRYFGEVCKFCRTWKWNEWWWYTLSEPPPCSACPRSLNIKPATSYDVKISRRNLLEE